MLPVGTILARAALIAKAPKYTNPTSTFGNIALDLLNAVLAELCLQYDYAACRSLFAFNFNPSLLTNFGSGPYPLPTDYLRASGSSGESQKSFFWTLNGVPYPMIPVDVSEFDMQVQQAGQQSYPWLWSTDVAFGDATNNYGRRWQWVGTVATTKGLQAATLAVTSSAIGLYGALPPPPFVGEGISGEGITPGTTLAAVANAPPGPYAVTLSLPAISTEPAGSVIGGFQASGYAYPPPSGAYAVTIRYQRMMPPVIDLARACWFPDDSYLIDRVAGELMKVTDDARSVEFLGDGERRGRAERKLQILHGNMDDKRNRPQRVELDRRNFGPSYQTLPNTKNVGW